MLRQRLRRGLYRRAEHVLGRLRLVDPRDGGTDAPDGASATSVSSHTSFRPAAVPAPKPAPASTGPSAAAVQAILDDMVRPGLQMDGGDITLVKVEDGDVYVELVGACSSCPSAVMTMKLGVERLLEEELPGFRSLIEVTPPAYA